MPPALKVEGVGKVYRIRHESGGKDSGARYRRLSEEILQYPKQLLSRFTTFPRWSPRSSSSEDFWALRDVCLDVQPGEVVGIIGRNGAGKSTLLKLLSRIAAPTTGRIELNGRVASLLEVGTGFHPELNGRENIFLNGAILGMARAEIQKKFDEIVDFAGVEKFLDTPVKRYSSGMYVRLAFAVAAHLEPEIFIVDEVLAVGDAAFQKKCLGKMGEVASSGRTVLLVSHNMQAVKSLCSIVCCFSMGKLIYFGDTSSGINAYSTDTRSVLSQSDPCKRPGSGEARIIAVTPTQAVFGPEEPKQFRFSIESPTTGSIRCTLSAHIVDASNIVICQCDSRYIGVDASLSGGILEGEFSLITPWLKPGEYTADFFLVSCGVVDRFERACHFQVSPVLPYDHVAPEAAMSFGHVLGEFNWVVKKVLP